MGVWQSWLEVIGSGLDWLAVDGGLGLGMAIVVLTLLARSVLLPLTWPIAYRAAVRQKKLARLAPELEQLKRKHEGRPEAYAAAMLELYRKHDLAPVDARALLGIVVQMPVFLGMFQVLRDVGAGARFLWVANLARPDFWLAVLAGVATALLTLANPDLPEHMRAFLILVPSIIAAVVALQFCSALAVYWVPSNLFSAAQTAAVHGLLARRIRTGAVTL